MRNKFNSAHQFVFDGAMLVVAPSIAAVEFFLARTQPPPLPFDDSALMAFALGAAFILFGVASLLAYNALIRPPPKRLSPSLNAPAEEKVSFRQKVGGVLRDLLAGFKTFHRYPPIFWRNAGRGGCSFADFDFIISFFHLKTFFLLFIY
jgi:hypothetical protein